MATERLSRLPDGRLLNRLKHRWRDGTSHVLFDALELLEKLAALFPPPRFHLVRYQGIFGPCASARDSVVPAAKPSHAMFAAPSTPPTAANPVTSAVRSDSDGRPVGPSRSATPYPANEEASLAGARFFSRDTTDEPPDLPPSRRLSWPELMRRVFAIDVLECPRCGGEMKILAAIHPPETTTAILACLGLPTRAPPTDPVHPEAEPMDSSTSDW